MAGKPLKRIAVTGGAGQIAYSLLFRLAKGELFGQDQPIALHILELPDALKPLEGVKMELEDSAFPLLREIKIGSDPNEVFEGIDCAFLVGAKPRGPGMERKDLLQENAKIFVEQGSALNRSAKKEVVVLVVGNPCNTNCLIALHNAPNIDPKQFHAMTRLDQNRASSLLALKSGNFVTDISQLVIWGNHSSTQVPDFYNAKIKGEPAIKAIPDLKWLQGEFIEKVQKRGAEIIAARGKSSAASAASAALDAMVSIFFPTPTGQLFSSGVYSEKNPYGIREDLVFSFPLISKGMNNWSLIPGLPWNDFLKEKIKKTELELIEERDFVLSMLPG